MAKKEEIKNVEKVENKKETKKITKKDQNKEIFKTVSIGAGLIIVITIILYKPVSNIIIENPKKPNCKKDYTVKVELDCGFDSETNK